MGGVGVCLAIPAPETISFEQNPAQAPIWETALRTRADDDVNPVSATETGIRAPGPWCVIRDALRLGWYAREHAFQRRSAVVHLQRTACRRSIDTITDEIIRARISVCDDRRPSRASA